ncbi:hypothetical protein DSO57_1025994 [Entomophthora muscae]|uniref:Uncharacterized protein n=1 Tax=Entomophthora muscae TaxID=34485 RepID=A0ACC2S450_9FUNG|nr:hypothetical protein DSO57_1025994 [Entomophthora muscae]
MLFITFLSAVCSSQVYSKREFLTWAERNILSSKLVIGLEKHSCSDDLRPHPRGSKPCYMMAAGHLSNNISDIHGIVQPKAKLSDALFLYSGSRKKAYELQEQGFDYVVIAAEKDPQCKYVFHKLISLAPALIGPGSTTITQAHSKQAINSWITGGRFSVSTSSLFPVGEFELEVSLDHERSVTKTVGSTVSRTFQSPAGQSCVPSMLSASAVCQKTEARFYLGKKGLLIEHKLVNLKNMFLPTFQGSTDYFTHKLGCIDYSRV